MATLAQRLNELATANTDGLLFDEEYRLLRQDVFERYSGNTPATTGRTRGLSSSSSSFPTSPKVIFQPLTPPSVSRAPSPSPSPSRPPSTPRKPVRSLTNLIRRATSSRPKKEPPLPPTPNTLKRAFKLSRKRSIDRDRDRDRDHDHNRDATSIRTSSSAGNSARTSGNTTIFSPPTSPTRMPTTTSSAIMGDDIFEDGGLSTTKELRQFIKQVEEEGKRVVQAFNELEQSAALRIDGPKPEWLLPNAHVVSHTRKSVSRNSSPSPLPRRKRKSSLSESSLSSQGTSMFSGRPSYSSTGHLPLAAGVSMDIDSDMANIQKRKADVMGRYEARLEYLRARLKGAELHEKLLKK